MYVVYAVSGTSIRFLYLITRVKLFGGAGRDLKCITAVKILHTMATSNHFLLNTRLVQLTNIFNLALTK